MTMIMTMMGSGFRRPPRKGTGVRDEMFGSGMAVGQTTHTSHQANLLSPTTRLYSC